MGYFRSVFFAVAVGAAALFSSQVSATEASAEKFGDYAYTGKFQQGIVVFSEIVVRF